MEATRRVLYVGLAGNVLVALTKFVAAAVTHSAAMLGEAVHSFVDSTNEILLLHGANRAMRPPDAQHPLGHGREVYFWSFVVSLLIFVVGAGVSILEGVHHVLDPRPIEHPLVSYVVLLASALFEGGSWTVAFGEFRRRKGKRGYFQAAVETKDPSAIMVFLEDSAALVGIALALAGTAASQLLDLPVFDGIASIAIGLLLAVIAAFLARENKALLMGEPAHDELIRSVQRLAEAERCIAHFNGMLSFQLAPRDVVVAISVDFVPSLRASELQAVVAHLEARVRKAHPEVVLLLVKPQDPETYRRNREARKTRWQR